MSFNYNGVAEPEQIIQFCMNQKSITTAIEKFIDRFMEWYEDEERAEQEILAQCVLQMFRKYYYSALEPEMRYTPAKIVNTLCERKCGASLMVAPNLSVTYKSKKIYRLQYQFTCFQIANHPMVKDLELFLETAADGIRMETPGIPMVTEYSMLNKNISIFDRHYINIITLVALEAGYIKSEKAGNSFIGKRTPKSEEFLSLDNEEKLRSLIDAAVNLCSKTIIKAFPEFMKEFAVEQIAGFLINPKNFESVMTAVFKKTGINLKLLERALATENLGEALETLGINEENTVKFYWLNNMLDIYFFTPFGYYLQLIQPLYPDIYDLPLELDELLSDIDNFQEVRNKLFSSVTEYNLTVLGENLAGKDRKTHRQRSIPDNISDEEMFQIVMESDKYLELDDEEFDLSDEEINGFLQMTFDNISKKQSPGKSRNGKIIDFPVKNSTDITTSMDNQVFIFKVKLFYAKRVWRQIEVKGSQTLHELHESILNSFGLDWDHLYAFFMSNKFWDPKTEYAHPAAESRSAAKVKISRLNLNLKQKFAYIYDFGDEHRFEVELIATHDVEKNTKYPREIKRNKPLKTVCDECQSAKNPLEWYCNDHDCYLCDNCVQDEKHQDCYIVNAIL